MKGEFPALLKLVSVVLSEKWLLLAEDRKHPGPLCHALFGLLQLNCPHYLPPPPTPPYCVSSFPSSLCSFLWRVQTQQSGS